MEFRILGPLEVSADGRRLTPGRAKQRALLVLLLLRPNQHVSIDRIMEALWGESPPETARTALHGHVSSLRKLLGPHRIATEPSGYVLKLEPGELDAERFETLVREASHARDSSSRARLLSEALALWRGEALADVMYLSFAEASLARLRELRLAALEQRIDADLELGRHAQLVPELELLLSVEPLREHLRWQLMLALYRCGRQADALHAYEDERRALSQELGLDPGAMLERLQQQILSRDPGLDLAGKPPPVPTQARKIVTVLVAELVPADTIDPEGIERRIRQMRAEKHMLVDGKHRIAFSERSDLLFLRNETLPFHSNGVRFSAFATDGSLIEERRYFSVGGGFVVSQEEADASLDHPRLVVDPTVLAHPFPAATRCWPSRSRPACRSRRWCARTNTPGAPTPNSMPLWTRSGAP